MQMGFYYLFPWSEINNCSFVSNTMTMERKNMELVKPMLAKPSSLPQADHEYAYEIKWDGIRAILYAKQGRVLLSSRNLRDITSQYPELAQLKDCLTQDTILDGEIVTLDSTGRPSFELLQSRMGLSSPQVIKNKMNQVPVTYIIFDVLQHGNNVLLNNSFIDRRQVLANLKLSGPFWQTSTHSIGNGASFLAVSRQLGLEGIIAKRLNSLYLPGKRTDDWLKIKNQKRQELVIGGWVPGKGSRTGRIGAILVGYYDISPEKGVNKPKKFIYAGKVGTGFSTAELDKLGSLLTRLQHDASPFAAKVPIKDAIFVEPRLIAEFEFTEWTANNTLRHPSYKGLRTDKDPLSVIRET
ncbi:Multifunctional non-homologous end joining DNA repair protein LigD [bioreactor metagenome]|uniref:Multifunctional non-homologous end joining DNA repair protein LigD n=1 Tax=bioreactor metagenome TaxID=1076179 RepID=A0A644ZIZ6_9ZZZZ